jgi:acyl-CoA thioesterase FadM
VVRGLDLRFALPIRDGDTISVSTRVVGMRRVMARRESEIVSATGATAGWCWIDWAMTDGRAPTRVPEEFKAFGGGSFSPTRVDLPSAPADAVRMPVVPRQRECDPMGHVNNGVYVDWLDEAVAVAGGASDVVAAPRRYRLEYLRAATAGARLVAIAWRDGDGWAFRLAGEDGGDVVRGRLDAGRTAAAD